MANESSLFPIELRILYRKYKVDTIINITIISGKYSREFMSNHPSDKAICQSIVGKIAELAALQLTDDEKSKYQNDFISLIEMFHLLDNINPETIKSTSANLIDIDQCREDIETAPKPDLSISCANFDPESNLFNVPQFIDEND